MNMSRAMNNKSRFCLARLNKQRLKGGTKDAPNKIHKEEGERWTKKQNEILRNKRNKEEQACEPKMWWQKMLHCFPDVDLWLPGPAHLICVAVALVP